MRNTERDGTMTPNQRRQWERYAKRDCCNYFIGDPVRIGRANYACVECGRDISLQYTLYCEMMLTAIEYEVEDEENNCD